MEEIKKLQEAEEAAAMALLNFAKSNRMFFSEQEESAIELAMELVGANARVGRVDRRRIEAHSLILAIITPTTGSELNKAMRAIYELAKK